MSPAPDRFDPARTEGREEMLEAYLDGELLPAEAQRVAAWLDDDPDALRGAEHRRRLADVLGAYEDLAVPEEFAAHVAARVGLGGARRAGRLVRPLVWAWSAAATAAAAVLLGILLLGGAVPLGPASERAALALESVPGDLLPDADLLLAFSDEEFHAWVLSDPSLVLEEDMGG